MADDDKDTIVPEEVTPPTETPVTPPVDAPKADDDVHDLINQLGQRIDDLTETVSQVVSSTGERDTQPVKKPWTHWGNH